MSINSFTPIHVTADCPEGATALLAAPAHPPGTHSPFISNSDTRKRYCSHISGTYREHRSFYHTDIIIDSVLIECWNYEPINCYWPHKIGWRNKPWVSYICLTNRPFCADYIYLYHVLFTCTILYLARRVGYAGCCTL